MHKCVETLILLILCGWKTTSDTNPKSQLSTVLLTHLDKLGFPVTLSLVSLFAKMTHRTQGSTSLIITSLLQGYFRRYKSAARWKVNKAKPQGFLSSGVSVPVKFGVHCALGMWMCSTWRFSEPSTLGIFMEASSCRHDQWWTQSPALPPFPEDGGQGNGADCSMLLIMDWSFWWPAPTLKLSRSPSGVASLE